MTRRYLHFALLACVAYSLVPPLLKIAMAEIPSTPAVFLSNVVLLLVVAGAIAIRNRPVRPYLGHRYTAHIVGMGVLLTVGLLTYYRALALGPVSIVVPIYGLFIVVSAFIGVVAMRETLSVRKVAGLGFSVLAIVLVSI